MRDFGKTICGSAYDILYAQLEKDYSCTLEEVKSLDNVYTKKKLTDGRRKYRTDDYLVKITSIGGKAIFCADEVVYDEIKSAFENIPAPWLDLYPNLQKLSEIIDKYGYKISDQHHFYLPTGINALNRETIEIMKKEFELQWFEQDEIEQFRGDERFCHALGFVEAAPDMLCVMASVRGEVVGMCGASADSSEMWQIGIDVGPDFKGRNIGPFLTILLKEEIIRRGILPYYGTAESHIQSQKVALKSGFLPAWWELYTVKK